MERTALPTAAPEEAASRPLLSVSLAGLLFLLVLLLAGAMRFVQLAAIPLRQDEAEAALATWSYWHGADAAGVPLSSPAYFTVQTPLIGLFGGADDAMSSDALARLIPALAGVLVVILLWSAREALGLVGSLGAAFLLAVSPMTALISRQAGGDALALLALVALFIGALRFRLEGGRRWPVLAAVALGFGLATSPLFYTGLLALVAGWLAHRRGAPAAGHDGEGLNWRCFALISAAVFLGTATCLLLRPAGLGGAAAQLGHWLAAFALPANLRGFFAPVALLARYELAAVTLGAGALVWGLWRGYPLPRFLAHWTVAALVLLLAQPGQTANVILVALPAALLAGQWLQHAFQEPPREATWSLFVFLLGAGIAIYFSGVRFVRMAGGQQDALGLALILALVVAVAIVTVNLVRGWDARAAFQGTLLALFVLLGAFSWSSGWWLTHHAANDPRAGLGPATDDDVRLLVEMLHEISYQTGAERYGLPLLSAVDTPVLRWYLRQFSAVQFGETVPPGTTTTALITRLDGPSPPVDDYTGLDLGLLNVGVERGERTPVSPPIETLRWWLFRESRDTIVQERVILWLRQDALPWNR